MAFCRFCGSQLKNSDARFCSFCGKVLSVPEDQPREYTPPVAPSVPAAQRQPIPAAPPEPEPDTVPMAPPEADVAEPRDNTPAREAGADSAPAAFVDQETDTEAVRAGELDWESTAGPELNFQVDGWVDGEAAAPEVHNVRAGEYYEPLPQAGGGPDPAADETMILNDWQGPPPEYGNVSYADAAANTPQSMSLKDAVHSSGGTKKKKGVLLPILIIVLILVLAVGGAFGFLYIKTSPDTFVKEMADALTTQDEEYLQSAVVGEEGDSLRTGELTALCNALSSESALEGFQGHLLEQINGAEGSSAYDAFSVQSKPYLYFFNEYRVAVKPITLTVESNVSNITVEVDGEEMAYQETDGVRSVQVLPGKHTLVGDIDTDYNFEKAETTVSCLSTSAEDNSVQLEFNVFDITINSSQRQGLKIYLNDIETDIRISGGKVTIPHAETGMVVKAVAQSGGSQVEAELVVGDSGASYAFDFQSGSSPTPAADTPAATAADDYLLALSEDELNAMVAQSVFEYYVSYILCTNSQDIGLLTHVVEEFIGTVEYRMENNNRDYIFDFETMRIDRDSIEYFVEDNVKSVMLHARFEYQYRNRSGYSNWSSGSSTQICTLIFDDGDLQWKVKDMEVDNTLELGSDLITISY